jgi:hypothetical protein
LQSEAVAGREQDRHRPLRRRQCASTGKSKIVSIVTLGFQKCNSAILSFQPPIEYSMELIFQPLSAESKTRMESPEVQKLSP